MLAASCGLIGPSASRCRFRSLWESPEPESAAHMTTPDRSAELMLLGQIDGIVQGLHIGAYGPARLRY